MACMVLVENPGNWHIYWPLRHATWGKVGADGKPVHETFTPTDLVMPFFLFIVGVSVVFALWNRKDDLASHRQTLLKVVRRTVILFALGLFFYAYPSLLNHFVNGGEISFEIMGVLQRIALVYLGSALIFLKCRPKTIVWVGVATLILYWGCTFIPVPGYPEPQFFRQYNTPGEVPSCFPEWVDAKVIGFANPSGLVSTFPAIVTGLIGVLAGILLKTEQDPKKTVRKMIGAGMLLLLAGYGWSFFFPIIKDLWTSSYTLVAGGYSLLGLTFIYWLVDVKQWKAWTPPFVAYGINCILVYVVSHLVASTLYVVQVGDGDKTISLHAWINLHWFQSWLAPINASLAFALVAVAFWFVPLWVMYRKGVVVKI